MFYCFIHNWYSTESPCPVCHPPVTITTTGSTSGTGEEKKEVLAKDKVKVDVFPSNGTDCMNGMLSYSFAVSDKVPKEKFPAIKAAIESVLNDDVLKAGETNLNVYPPHLSPDKKYTEKDIEQAEQRSFEAAREEKLKVDITHEQSVYDIRKYPTFKAYKNSNAESKTVTGPFIKSE